jgi:hypothetical protein
MRQHCRTAASTRSVSEGARSARLPEARLLPSWLRSRSCGCGSGAGTYGSRQRAHTIRDSQRGALLQVRQGLARPQCSPAETVCGRTVCGNAPAAAAAPAGCPPTRWVRRGMGGCSGWEPRNSISRFSPKLVERKSSKTRAASFGRGNRSLQDETANISINGKLD